MNRHAFFSCHPLVNLLYFALVLWFSAFFLHPLFLAVSLLSALLTAVQINGAEAVRRSARWIVPAALFAAGVNAAFNHEGVTILTYFPSGNPLTLESLCWSAAAAGMLAAVLLWFSCWNTVMTSDKLMYLFGRLVPALSLLLSMTLRFVPRFQRKFCELMELRRAARQTKKASGYERLKDAVEVFSVMIGWSLENASETAASMKSRGYGLPGRTAFFPYCFDRRDRRLLWLLSGCGAYILAGWMAGGIRWRYYPAMRGAFTPFSVSVALAELILCLTPAILQWRDERAWSFTASNS